MHIIKFKLLNEEWPVAAVKNGGGEGSRTPGPRLMSPLLYHLSYTATPHVSLSISREMVCRHPAARHRGNRLAKLPGLAGALVVNLAGKGIQYAQGMFTEFG